MSYQSLNALLKEYLQTISLFCEYVLWLGKSQNATSKCKLNCPVSQKNTFYCKLRVTKYVYKMVYTYICSGEKQTLHLFVMFPSLNVFILLFKKFLIYNLAHQ